MIKPVKCPACATEFAIDLEKYGGKKIKCKSCQAVISVPTLAQANDEFEVVEDVPQPTAALIPPAPTALPPTFQPPAASPAVVPPGTPASILQRNRMASHRGAVNIALLQRGESSREEIREAFLQVHGSPADRLPDSIVPYLTVMKEIDAQLAGDPRIASMEKLQSLYGRLLAPPVQSMNLFTQVGRERADEDIYKEAVRILGRPLQIRNRQDEESGFFGKLKAAFSGETLEKAKKEKMATIKAALEVLENIQRILTAEREEADRESDRLIAEHLQECRARLDQVRRQIQAGQLDEATHTLHGMLKSAQAELLGQVLVALSQAAFLSGNSSNAARHIQDAICFGAAAPVDMGEHYNDLWAKAAAGLPKS